MKPTRCKWIAILLIAFVMQAADSLGVGAIIHEPFADSNSSLAGNTPGTGLAGTWAGTGNIVAGLTYGDLPTSDNSIEVTGGWSYQNVGVENSVNYGWLLEDGGDMWFSVLVESSRLYDARTFMALGNSPFTANSGLLNNPAQAIGIAIGANGTNGKVWAAVWETNGRQGNGGVPPSAVNGSTFFGNLILNETALIVGHVQWGATALDNDTITLYMPDTNLVMGAAVAQAVGVVDQSTFDILAMSNLRATDWDEFRFGYTYDTVVGGTTEAIAPNIDTLNPANGATDIALDTNLLITFDENIRTNVGNVIITNITDGTSFSIPMGDSQLTVSNATLRINPDANLLSNTDYAILIESGAVVDRAANPFGGIASTNVWHFKTTATDSLPPGLFSVNPAHLDVDVLVGADLVATFDEAVQAGSGDVVISNLTDATSTAIPIGDGQISILDDTLTINPTTDLENGDVYAVLIEAGAIKDQAGTPNDFAGIGDTNTWQFTVDAIPGIESISPTNHSESLNPVHNLEASFSEPMFVGSGNVVLTNLTAGTSTTIPAGDAQISVSGNQLTINPTSDLTKGQQYAVLIDAGAIEDATGNAFPGIASTNTWQFKVSRSREVIYEPFVDSDPTLLGNAIGLGLSGTWQGSQQNVVSGLTYGYLPAGNNSVQSTGGWDYNNASVELSSDYSSLLVDGGEMWFSMLVSVPSAWLSTTRTFMSLGNSKFTSNSYLLNDPAQGVGISIGHGGKVWAGLWATRVGGNSGAPPTAVNGSTAYGLLTADEAALIVGHVQWGATALDNDTVTLYMPDANLTMGAAVAQSVGIVDQSTFTILATSNLRACGWDEIRFGLTSDSVIGKSPEGIPPAIDTLSPTNNAVGVLLNTNLVATFDEDIVVGSGNVILTNLTAGTSQTIPIGDSQVTVSGTTLTLTLATSLADSATYAVLMDAGVVQDSVENDFAGISSTNVWRFSTVSGDTIAPEVSAFSPTNETVDVLVGANLVATFNESIQTNAGSVVITNLTDATSITIAMGDSQISAVGDTLTINPTANLENGDVYAVLIEAGAVQDQAGAPNDFAGISDTTTWRFTVDALPGILSTDPANGATDYNYTLELVATFSEPISSGSGTIVLTNLTAATSTTIPIGDSQVLIDGTALAINPSPDLTRGEVYAVLMDAGTLVDATGNPFSGISSTAVWQFTVTTNRYWTPANLTDAVWGWWDPSDAANVLTNTAYGRVYELTDISGRGNHMRQTTASKQPATGIRTIGGKLNALDYEQASGQLLRRIAGGWSNLGTNGMISIFAVFDYDSDSRGMVNFQNTLYVQRHAAYYGGWLSYADGAFQDPSIFNVNMNWDGSATLPDSYINAFVNGSNQVANSAYATQFPADNSGALYMTFMSDNNQAATMDGALGEVVIVMDTSEEARVNMEGYLAHKWNLAANLPAGHPWKSGPPTDPEPSITSLSPTNNATEVALAAELVATFSENIFTTGGNVVLSNLTASSAVTIPMGDPQITVSNATLTIALDTVFQKGATYAVLIDAGTIKDSTINTFAGISDTTAWRFTTTSADFEPPVITTLSPASSAVDVLVGANLVATFNEPIQVNTGNITLTNLTDATSITIAIGDSQIQIVDETLTINPTANLDNGDLYAVLIDAGAVTDQSVTPNDFAGISDTTTWRFTVDALPTLVSVDPANGTGNFNYALNLVATFSEPVFAGSGNVVLQNLTASTSTTIPIGDARISIDGNQLTINPIVNFSKEETYAVLIASGALGDATGNVYPGIASTTTWRFTIANERSWQPFDIVTSSELVAWFDAADASSYQTSGSAVTGWTDKSGNGNDLSQTEPTRQPATGIDTYNGNNVFTFEPNPADSLLGPVVTFNNVVMVCDNPDMSYGNRPSALGGHSFARPYILHFGNDNLDAYPDTLGTWYINGSTSKGGDTTVFTNPTMVRDPRPWTTDICVGSDYQAANRSWNGGIAEVIFLNGILEDDLIKIEGYLAWKWGLEATLPSGHAWKNAPPMVQPSGSLFRFR